MTRENIHIALPATDEQEWLAVKEPIETGWMTQGPKVAAFEKAFAERHQASHALATTSCTTGLHLILAAMGVGPGDEVIIPAFTWVATANVVLYCGAKPVFVDVETTTNNIDLSKINDAVTDKTKAVIVVHLFGLCVDIPKLRSQLPSDIKIIEDAACAAGAELNGVSAGSLGDAASFSFHPRKTITTGEGGMITTNDATLAEMMEKLRNHGAEISEEQRHHGPRPHILPDFNMLGFNYRMTDMQGAIGLVQLAKLDAFLAERTHWANYYRSELAAVEWLQMPANPSMGKHGYQAFVTFVDPDLAPAARNVLMDKLQDLKISTRPGTHALHMLNFYQQQYGLDKQDFPQAALCNDCTMAIPLHNRMSADDYAYIVKSLKAL